MEMTLVETLRTLRDIHGVQGSFVVRAGDGQLLGRDLPSVIDDEVLANVGPRIDRLLDVGGSEAYPATESIALRFGGHRLDIKRMGTARLCVLAESTVSAPALRMAINLVHRKLDNRAWEAAPAPRVTEPATRVVQFRGRQTTL